MHPLSLSEDVANRRTRALDVGAGVSRVTADVLLHLVSDVVLVEPVEPFVHEAFQRGKASETSSSFLSTSAPGKGNENDLEVVPWKGIADKTKSVTFVRATLQDFEPAHPTPGLPNAEKVKILGRVGYAPPSLQDDLNDKYDVLLSTTIITSGAELRCLTGFKKQPRYGTNVDSDIVHTLRRTTESANEYTKTTLMNSLTGLILDNRVREVQGATTRRRENI